MTFLITVTRIFSQPSTYIDGWLYGMSMTSVVCNVPVLSQNDSTYHNMKVTSLRYLDAKFHHPNLGASPPNRDISRPPLGGVYTPPTFRTHPSSLKRKNTPQGGWCNKLLSNCLLYRHGIHVQKCHGASPASLLGRNV